MIEVITFFELDLLFRAGSNIENVQLLSSKDQRIVFSEKAASLQREGHICNKNY